jgi:hypothetical protein
MSSEFSLAHVDTSTNKKNTGIEEHMMSSNCKATDEDFDITASLIESSLRFRGHAALPVQ